MENASQRRFHCSAVPPRYEYQVVRRTPHYAVVRDVRGDVRRQALLVLGETLVEVKAVVAQHLPREGRARSAGLPAAAMGHEVPTRDADAGAALGLVEPKVIAHLRKRAPTRHMFKTWEH